MPRTPLVLIEIKEGYVTIHYASRKPTPKIALLDHDSDPPTFELDASKYTAREDIEEMVEKVLEDIKEWKEKNK